MNSAEAVHSSGAAFEEPARGGRDGTPDRQEEEEETLAFLLPRLAAYTALETHDDDDDDDVDSDSTPAEGDTAYANEEREDQPRSGHPHLSEAKGPAAAAAAAPWLPDGEEGIEGEDEAYEHYISDGAEEPQEEEEEGPNAEREETASDGSDGSPKAGRSSDDLTGVFPTSRVKDLLKYEGSSSVVSRDACLAASEAVALILRDLAKCAAAEAQRRHRKTVTYEDIARTAQMLDRFAYLSEVVPPLPVVVPAPHGGSAAAARSRSRAQDSKKGKTKEGSKGGGTAPVAKGRPLAGHPMIPGADAKRQTTLRF